MWYLLSVLLSGKNHTVYGKIDTTYQRADEQKDRPAASLASVELLEVRQPFCYLRGCKLNRKRVFRDPLLLTALLGCFVHQIYVESIKRNPQTNHSLKLNTSVAKACPHGSTWTPSILPYWLGWFCYIMNSLSTKYTKWIYPYSPGFNSVMSLG